MVRTKADNCARKAVAAKAPRKALGSSSAGTSTSMMSPKAGKNTKYADGNAACPRPTPDWQKSIGSFFQTQPGKENTRPSEENDADVEMGEGSSAGASASGSSKECSSGAPSSLSQGSSSSSKSKKEEEAEEEECAMEEEEEKEEEAKEEPESPPKKQKRNGLIDSDSDDD